LGSCGRYDNKEVVGHELDRNIDSQLISIGYCPSEGNDKAYLNGVAKDLNNLQEYFVGHSKYWSFYVDPEMSIE